MQSFEPRSSWIRLSSLLLQQWFFKAGQVAGRDGRVFVFMSKNHASIEKLYESMKRVDHSSVMKFRVAGGTVFGVILYSAGNAWAEFAKKYKNLEVINRPFKWISACDFMGYESQTIDLANEIAQIAPLMIVGDENPQEDFNAFVDKTLEEHTYLEAVPSGFIAKRKLTSERRAPKVVPLFENSVADKLARLEQGGEFKLVYAVEGNTKFWYVIRDGQCLGAASSPEEALRVSAANQEHKKVRKTK